MKPHARREVADALAAYDSLLEVGVGRRPEVAAALAADGHGVVAIDVDPAAGEELPAEVTFREESVLALAERAAASASDRSPIVPDRNASASDRKSDPPVLDPIYRVDAVYALNLPAELQRPIAQLATAIDADCLFTTLGFESPVVPVKRRTVGDTTLYVARDRLG